MDTKIKRNIAYIMIYVAGILTGLTFIWRYPKAYSILLLILAIGFILSLNNILLSKVNNDNRLIIKIR